MHIPVLVTPKMAREVGRELDWVELLVTATVARLLCRKLPLQNECLRLEIRTLEAKTAGRSDVSAGARFACGALSRRPRLLIIILTPGDGAGWRPSMVHHPVDESVLIPSGPRR